MKIKFSLWIVVAVLSLGLVSCYPDSDRPIEDYDSTSTFYDEDAFSPPPASVALFWEVNQVENDDEDDIDYNGEIDDEILNTTLENLVDLYGEANVTIISEDDIPSPTPSNSNVQVVTPSDADPTPDVDAVVAPSIILRNQYVGAIYPGYPWYPWWDWWYPCYYCGYPPYVSYTKYEVGTVILDMIDTSNLDDDPNTEDDTSPMWVAVFKGLVSSNESSNASRVITNIDQAFEQSPYLK